MTKKMEQPRADNRAVLSTAKAGLPLLAMTLVQSVLIEEAIKQSPVNLSTFIRFLQQGQNLGGKYSKWIKCFRFTIRQRYVDLTTVKYP